MYDMYPWDEDSAASGTDQARPDSATATSAAVSSAAVNSAAVNSAAVNSAAVTSAAVNSATARSGAPVRLPRPRPESAISAVQVALDRRDNGGDPVATPGPAPSAPAPQ